MCNNPVIFSVLPMDYLAIATQLLVPAHSRQEYFDTNFYIFPGNQIQCSVVRIRVPEPGLCEVRQLQQRILCVPESLHDGGAELHGRLDGLKRRQSGDAACVGQHDQLSHARYHLLDQRWAATAIHN